MDLAAYHRFAAAAEPIGIRILIIAVAGLFTSIAALIVHAIRPGTRDEPEPGVVAENRPMIPIVIQGAGASTGRSKRKTLAGSSGFISNESLVDGTATFGQRMAVVAIVMMFGCFFLMFVGIGLMAMASNPLAVLLPIIPGIFLFKFGRDAWSDHLEARRAFAARKQS